jgi:hypothetical protein
MGVALAGSAETSIAEPTRAVTKLRIVSSLSAKSLKLDPAHVQAQYSAIGQACKAFRLLVPFCIQFV